jgi:DNA-binding transcriptional LysR family regulator
MVPGMELRHLRYLVAVADTGSFGRAAAKLSITQPALWRQVHDLEAELRVRLFERVGRRVRLTIDGVLLVRSARAVLTSAEHLLVHAQTLRGGDVGYLRIGATPQVMQTVLAPFLARYLRRHPDIEVQLVEEGGASLPRLVERGDVDLALGIPRGGEPLEGRLLFPVRILAVLPPTHRLVHQPVVDIAQLRDESVLLLRAGFASRELFDAACRVSGVQARIVLESGDSHSLLALAAAGRGLAIVPSTVRLPGRVLRGRPLVQGGRSVGTWGRIVWDRRRYLPGYAMSFVDGLIDHIRRHGYPGRELERRAPPLPAPDAPSQVTRGASASTPARRR